MEKSSSVIPFWLSVTWIIVAAIGFIDASYLTVEHFQGGGVTCSVIEGCDTVLKSKWSSIGPIPTALLGAGYYLVMLVAGIVYMDRKRFDIMRAAGYFSIAGLVASAVLFYIQWQIIQAFCQYCLLSALTSTVLFVLGMIVINKTNFIDVIQKPHAKDRTQ